MVEEYRQAGARADAHPRVVTYSSKHPQSRAGAILRYGASGDVLYGERVADGSGSGNVWAPFASEVDWKIAKWAKLRGAGSTAFSDLLGIDGVC